MKKLIIGSDKSGFLLKEAVKKALSEDGWELTDCGTADLEHGEPYFAVAAALAPRVAAGEFEKGILICGTGAGMAVVANKYRGVYAVVCNDPYDARMCRAINGANVMTLGGWKIGPELGIEMARTFLKTDFLQGLEPWRQTFLQNAGEQVRALEETIYGGGQQA